MIFIFLLKMARKIIIFIYITITLLAGFRAESAKIPLEKYLNIRSATNPVFSYDDEYIAFLTNITGVNQIWKIKSSGGWANQLTYFNDTVRFLSLSPSEDKIIFGMDNGGNENIQLYITDINGTAIELISKSPTATYNFGAWSKDGKMIAFTSNEREKEFFDVYIKEIGTGEIKMVYKSNSTFLVEDWAHNNEYILLKEIVSGSNANLYLLKWKSGEIELLTPHKGDAKYENAKFNADDSAIWLITDYNNNFMQLAKLNIENKELEFFKTIPYDYEEFELSKDGRYLAYTINIDGISNLIIKDLKTKKDWGFEGLHGLIFNLEFSNNSAKLAFVYTSSKDNPDIWLFDINKQEVSQLTFSDKAGIPPESFIEPELIKYKSFDDLEIPSFFYKPKNKERFPAIIMVHGGPEAQARPKFNPIYQYLLNEGFAILEPNIRGSTGYGKNYSHLDDKYKRIDAIKDIQMAAKWLKQQKEFKINKIAIMGASYGGFIALASLGLYPDLFSAGIELFGISNFITFLKRTATYRQKWRISEYGDPDDDKIFLQKISPLTYAHKITAPLLIIHGKNDIRVPFEEAVQIANKIKKKGGKVKLIAFPDEGHGILKLKNRLKAYKAIVNFLNNLL